MVNANQIRPSEQGHGAWYCVAHSKRFESDAAIHQHCREAHADSWCERCNWLFISASALDNHKKHSTIHWVCYEEACSNDYKTQPELDRHQEDDHAVCIPCWTHFEVSGKPSRSAWVKHQCEKHFMCEMCGKRLEDETSRSEHQKTHLSRDKVCFGCPRSFTSYSAMMIHLEAGTCDRTFDIADIDRWAAQCFPARGKATTYACTHSHCRDADGEKLMFRCLSALLQHQESRACPLGYGHETEKLLKFIALRIRIAPYPAGQALTVLAKLYVENSGGFTEQLGKITEAVPVLPLEKKDGRVRTISCALPTGSVPWTH